MVVKANRAVRAAFGLTKPAIKSLITPERAQKLDLLVHLIVNFKRPLIVSGPAGIGKSTLLSVLGDQRPVEGHYCFMNGDHRLSISEIQEHVRRFLEAEEPSCKGFSLDDALALIERKKNRVILIIDDAGKMVPGLIDGVSDYALENPVLRVVFVLTHDELAIKNTTDRAIEDCHFIELSPLSEKQCREFLQNLSGKPGAPISFNAISDSMVDYLYRETHGIPGKIVALLPRLSKFESGGRSFRYVAGLFVLAGLAYLGWELISRDIQDDLTTTLPDLKPSTVVSLPIPPVPAASDQTAKIVTVEQKLEPVNPIEVTRDEQIEVTDHETNLIEKIEDESIPGEKPEPVSAGSLVDKMPEPVILEELNVTESRALADNRQAQDDRAWLFSQSSEHFTLQLMVLSSKASIINVLNKYKSLQQNLKFIETRIGGKEKFVLLYGSFASHAEAAGAAGKLPVEFKGAWVRRFAVLQNDIKNAG